MDLGKTTTEAMGTHWIMLIALFSVVLGDTLTSFDMPVARGRGAAAGGGGKILIGYGYTTSYSNWIHIYDVATRNWTTTSYGQERDDLAAAYADGIVMFGGGLYANKANDVTIYNTSTGEFSTSYLSQNRSFLSAAGAGQRILFGGGSATAESAVVDIYFTNNGTWAVSAFKSGTARFLLAAAATDHLILFGGGYGGGYRDVVDIYNTETDLWENVEYLSQARAYLGAAGAGEVAVFAGGKRNSVELSRVVDVYNATSGTWFVSYLTEPRRDLVGAAVDVGSPFVIFTGGLNYGGMSGRIDIFDSRLKGWHVAESAIPRNAIDAGACANVTIFGGGKPASYTTYSDMIEISDGCRPRSSFAVSTGSAIHFIGGEGGGPIGTISYSTVDVYDIISEKWSAYALNKARRDAAVAVAGGSIMIGGGSEVGNGTETSNLEVYNISTGLLSEASLISNRSRLSAAGIGNMILFGGGYPTSAHVDIFDIATGGHNVTNLTIPRYDLAAGAVIIPMGHAYLFGGGRNATHAFDIVDIFLSDMDTWTTAHLADARYNLAGIGAKDAVFFAGGENGTAFFDTVDIMNGTTSSSSVIYLSTARSKLAAIASSDHSYVAFGGGKNENGSLNSVEIYNITYGIWTMKTLSIASYGLSAGSIGEYIVFMAGKTDENVWACAFDWIELDIPDTESSSSLSSFSSTSSSSSASSGSGASSGASSASGPSSSTSSAGSISSSSRSTASGARMVSQPLFMAFLAFLLLNLW